MGKTLSDKKNFLKKSKAASNISYLQLLWNTKSPKKRKLLIDFANDDQISAIAECVLNVLKGKVPISKTIYKKLKKHKEPLRTVVKKSVSIKKKKKALKQSGGALGALIPAAISLLGSLIPQIF